MIGVLPNIEMAKHVPGRPHFPKIPSYSPAVAVRQSIILKHLRTGSSSGRAETRSHIASTATDRVGSKGLGGQTWKLAQ